MTTGVKVITKNRQAYHQYFIEETLEAGIELVGTEVKSIRGGKVNLKDSWISIDRGEAFVKGMHISPYEQGNIFNKDPMRVRRLLLHKQEILKLQSSAMRDGYSQSSAAFKHSKVKVEVALAKGKKLHDKRDSAAEKTAKRDIDRALKERSRY